MTYKNTKTGAIVDSSCIISGENWIKVDDSAEQVDVDVDIDVDHAPMDSEAPYEEGKEDEEGEDVIDDSEDDPEMEPVSKKEIMQELDAMGIKYNARASKKDLYDLMKQGR